jgi:hypothetical protein
VKGFQAALAGDNSDNLKVRKAGLAPQRGCSAGDPALPPLNSRGESGMKTNKIYQFSFKSEAGWMMMSSFILAGLGLLIFLILRLWSLILNLWY